MAINKSQKVLVSTLCTKESGFALLIAVIFMSVMLSFGISLGSLAYKQQMLASGAIQSQYAFYAADTALECLLFEDQQNDLFNFTGYASVVPPLLMPCLGTNYPATEVEPYTVSGTRLVLSARMDVGAGFCADVTVYKYAAALPSGQTTFIYSQGYNVPCTQVGSSPTPPRLASRGLKAEY